MALETITIDNAEQLSSVLDEWRAFYPAGPEGAGFFGAPDTVAASIGDGTTAPFVVILKQGGVVCCVAPFIIQRVRFHLRFSVFSLASFNSREMHLAGSSIPCSKSADYYECMARVFEAVRGASFDLLVLDSVAKESRLFSYLHSKLAGQHKPPLVPAGYQHDRTFVLQLPDALDAYLRTLGDSTRKSLKRRSQKLFREHAGALVKYTAVDDVQAFLDNVNTIYQDAWQARTYGHRLRNTTIEVAKYSRIAAAGHLRSYVLVADNKPVACQVGFQYGDTFYACDFAFAREAARLGPGAVLMYLMLEDLFQNNRPRLVDLRPGDSPQKQSFRATAQDVADIYFAATFRYRALLAIRSCLYRIECAVRWALTRCRIDRFARRLLKRRA